MAGPPQPLIAISSATSLDPRGRDPPTPSNPAFPKPHACSYVDGTTKLVERDVLVGQLQELPTAQLHYALNQGCDTLV